MYLSSYISSDCTLKIWMTCISCCRNVFVINENVSKLLLKKIKLFGGLFTNEKHSVYSKQASVCICDLFRLCCPFRSLSEHATVCHLHPCSAAQMWLFLIPVLWSSHFRLRHASLSRCAWNKSSLWNVQPLMIDLRTI